MCVWGGGGYRNLGILSFNYNVQHSCFDVRNACFHLRECSLSRDKSVAAEISIKLSVIIIEMKLYIVLPDNIHRQLSEDGEQYQQEY